MPGIVACLEGPIVARARLISTGGAVFWVGTLRLSSPDFGGAAPAGGAARGTPRAGVGEFCAGDAGAGGGVRCVSCSGVIAVGGTCSLTSSPIGMPSSGLIVGTSGKCRRQISQPTKCWRICSASESASRPSTKASKVDCCGQESEVGALTRNPATEGGHLGQVRRVTPKYLRDYTCQSHVLPLRAGGGKARF